MTPLRKRMIEDLQIRNYSPRTIAAYTRAVAAFACHFRKPPDLLGPQHVRQYQIFLLQTKKASWATFNQTVCALRFLYNNTLHRKDLIQQIPFPKREHKLPAVLSTRELSAFFAAVDNLKHRTVLMTMYAAGLRVSEAVNLQIPDIDSDRMLLRVRQGKGKRDRYVTLPPALLAQLRLYWKAYKPKSWLFPGRSHDQFLSPSAVQRACGWARVNAHISKPVTTHSMRHCFATHHLEAGTNLRKIQLALGHGSLNTTAVYLHVASHAPQSTEKQTDLLGALTEGKNKP
jgi:integrase/recombinase XerD